MNAKHRGPKKPAVELTNEEAAERLFGKRVVRKVDRELAEAEKPVKVPKLLEKSSTGERVD